MSPVGGRIKVGCGVNAKGVFDAIVEQQSSGSFHYAIGFAYDYVLRIGFAGMCAETANGPPKTQEERKVWPRSSSTP